MSPPIASSAPSSQTLNTDFLNNRESKFSGSFDFSYSSGVAGGFALLGIGSERSKFSGQVKPRLMKMRKKQPGTSQNGKSVKNSSGFAPGSENSGQVSGGTRSANTSQNSSGFGDISNGSVKVGNYVGFMLDGNNDSNVGLGRNLENRGCSGSLSASAKFCNMGIVFGADKINSMSNSASQNGNSLFGEYKVSSDDGYFVFGSDKDSSILNPLTGNAGPVFGANKHGSTLNTNFESGDFVFGIKKNNRCFNSNSVEKESCVNGRQSGIDEVKKFDNLGSVFGTDKYEPTKMEQIEFNNSDSQSSGVGFEKVKSASFVFCATKSDSVSNSLDKKKEDCGENVGKNESSKDAGKRLPDLRGKTQLDASGDSEKVSHSCFAFPSNRDETSTKVHVSSVFHSDSNDSKLGKDVENNSISKRGGRYDFANSTKDNTNSGREFHNNFANGGFVFGGIRSKKSSSADGSNVPVDEMNQLNCCKAEDSNGFMDHCCNMGTYYNFKSTFGSKCCLGTDFTKSQLFELSDTMKGLIIDGSEAVAHKISKFSSNSSDNTGNVFVFGSNGRNPGCSTDIPDTVSWNWLRDETAKGNDPEKGDGIHAKRDSNQVAHENTGKTADFCRPNVDNILSDETNNINLDSGVRVSNEQTHSWCSASGTFGKDNNPITKNKNASDYIHLTQNNIELNGMPSSSFFSSVRIGVQPNGDFCEMPSINQAEKKGGFSFMSTPVRLESHTDFGAPNTKFSFLISDLFPGVNKNLEFSEKCKSVRSRRLKKANGKSRQQTLLQQLAEQDQISKEGSSQNNYESPECGSPMDFSPCQDACTNNTPSSSFATMATGVKGEYIGASEKDCTQYSERMFDDENSSNISTSLPVQDALSAIRRQYKKKYKLKVGSNHKTQSPKASSASSSSSVQTHNTSDLGRAQVQSSTVPFSQSKEKIISKADKENGQQGPTEAATEDVCEHWRMRGNQAYHAGKLVKAEEFYSMGINTVPHASIQGCFIKPLLLCYSNRAATRMSVGRMREALEDCMKATCLDPCFLKATVRAGNCHLVLGEVEDAKRCYKKCLESGIDVCLDRRVIIEAADGLQKTQKVTEFMHQSAKLLQERTQDAATSALGNIVEALMISRYSERLLEMKGEALCTLRMYSEVIQLCEQTLDISEKNIDSDQTDDSHVRLWRWRLLSMSHYHLGRLDMALDLIDKIEELISVGTKSINVTQETSIPFAATIRELLQLKKLGNEAFQSGRHTEAVEHYTGAISKSGESRPFMAICFCNRAAAYQALGQIVDAIADCSLAIALDENYVKALSRRATLHEMIRDYKQAVHDLQKLVSLLESQIEVKTQQSGVQDKSSGSSVKDLRRTCRRLSSIEEKAKTQSPLDLYLILGIKASDTESEIKKAYRKAALKHHPDKAGQLLARSDGGDDGRLWKEVGDNIHKDADRLFKIIGEAYAVLSDPSKRSKYNIEEEVRNSYRDSKSEGPSMSYTSPYEKGTRYERQSGFYSSSSERSNSRRYWNETWKSSYGKYSRY